MSEDLNTIDYEADPRVPCKYGVDCYQKNPTHHEKFKHPSKKKHSNEKNTARTTVGGTSETREKQPKTQDKTPKTQEKLPKTPKESVRIPKAENTGGDSGERGMKRNTLANWLTKPPDKRQKTISNGEDQEKKTEKQKRVSEVNEKLDGDSKTAEKIDETLSASDNEAGKSDSEKDKMPTHNSKTPRKEKNPISSVSLLPMDADVNTKIKTFFLVDMPDDFYKFWDLCEHMGSLILSKGNPLDAFKSVGLKLVGPFDVLANRFNENIIYSPEALLRHWRYYYDPPEFQTVIKGDDSTGFHLGYFRDDPKEKPVFVASNSGLKSYVIKPVAENLFGAVNAYLEDSKKRADPFAKLKIVKLQNSLTTFAKKEGFTLGTKTPSMQKREGKVVTRLFHKAGLVVPYDKNTDIGYRELVENDATIKVILTRIENSKSKEECKGHLSQLQPVITFANIANDECDFGTSLELGLDLFSFGCPVLHCSAKLLMTTAYGLLGRTEFCKIIEAHLEDRKKGCELSIIK